MGAELVVLCVAGEPALRDLLGVRFESRGVAVETAGGEAAALELLDERRVDCVVSTQELADGSGLELLEGVRDRAAELPFVLFVAERDERLARAAVGAGATDYLLQGGTNPFALLVDRAVGYAERYRERAALERVRERYEVAGRAVSDVIWERSLADDTVRWGAGVEATLGYDRDGRYDRGWWLERVHPEDRDTVRSSWASALDPAEPGGFECSYRFRRADGSTAHVVDSGEVVREDGEPVRLVGALRDVTERREREAELDRKEREIVRQNERLEDFASVVSHDLRNPLNVARGRVEFAMEHGDLDQLADASAALERMDALIDDMLALARDREIVEDRVPVPLGDAARVAWANVPDREDAELAVETDCRPLAAPDRLQQLLENLLANAVQHGTRGDDAAREASTDDEGSAADGDDEGSAADRDDEGSAADGAAEPLTVRVGRLAGPSDPRSAAGDGFYVADDGVGIPQDRRGAVFDAGHTTADEGSGFGLAIVREVAGAHGWSATVTGSEAGGARFEFRGVEFEDDGPTGPGDSADP